jgi:hypothetical protein
MGETVEFGDDVQATFFCGPAKLRKKYGTCLQLQIGNVQFNPEQAKRLAEEIMARYNELKIPDECPVCKTEPCKCGVKYMGIRCTNCRSFLSYDDATETGGMLWCDCGAVGLDRIYGSDESPRFRVIGKNYHFYGVQDGDIVEVGL